MSPRTWKPLIAVGALAIVAACADERSPAATMPVGPSLALNYPGCDFTQIRKNAKGYFVSPRDAVYELIQLLSSQYKGSGAAAEAAVKSTAFRIAAHVEASIGTDAIYANAESIGDAFLKGVFACGGLPVENVSFAAALGANGLFAVRGGPNDPANPITSRGTPTYGAETVGTNTWAGSVGLQFIMYGFPIGFNTFTNEPPAATTAFELNTFPAVATFPNAIRGGVCQTTGATPRLQHNAVILEFQQLVFCPTVASLDRREQPTTMLAFAQRVASWLAPRPLYASSAVVLGGTGGLLRGLSPIGAVNVDVTTAEVTITSQPTTGFVNTPITPAITVKAETANDTPLDGLTIQLNITGNNGSYIVKEGTNIAVTQNGGIATFPNLEISKAGGYTFVAVGYFNAAGPYTAPSAVSLMINLSGQPQ